MNKHYDSINNWLIDPASATLLHLVSGERKRLGEYQFKLLNFLIKDPGRIWTREELTFIVWDGRIVGNNSLPNAIHALRAALEDNGKKQKIIKTIPKKGYLLEPEYCNLIDKEESEVIPDSEDVVNDFTTSPWLKDNIKSPASDNIDAQQPFCTEHEISSNAPVYIKLRLGVIIFLFITLATFGGLGITKSYKNKTNILTSTETQSNVYSNVNLYIIGQEGYSTWEQEEVFLKIKDTLYKLNQSLQLKAVMMNVYFFVDNQTLNYTFSLENECDSRQLVMTIYHWRNDKTNLNALILRETRRKLNEMAAC